MDITKLAGKPELFVSIGGREYGFSELELGPIAELQAFVNRTVPHPLDVLRGRLEGFPTEAQKHVLEQARKEAANWPPQVGTAAGAAALLGSEAGQLEALHAGLNVHHGPMSRDDAYQVFRELRKDANREARRAKREGRGYDGEGKARLIFGVLFGLDPHDDEEERGLPKA